MGSQVWSLLSLAVGLNLVLGALVAAFKLPIYLDCLGTVLVAALAGPWPASLAGGCGVALLGLTSPTALAFLPVGVAVGLLAGVGAKFGVFRKAWTAGLAGALVGVAGAAMSAPISTYLFGGVTGGGTDLMVAFFRAAGMSTLQAARLQGLLVDPLDKGVTFLLVYGLLRALPRRATAAFPLAEKLPSVHSETPPYRPQKLGQAMARAEGREPLERDTVTPGFPEAATGWKLLHAISVLLVAGLSSTPQLLTLALLALLIAYGLAAPALTWRVSWRLWLALLPLAVSLILIHGLIARQEGEVRVLWLGLSWSPDGLRVAWQFLVRVAMMLLALSFFLATTSLQRLAEQLLRWRVPYPLVFVLLTGANLGARLQQRWKIVEEAQEARGLILRPAGLWARVRVMVGLLTPTLGAVFSEIPLRAANLESRGFLQARPKSPVPRAWRGERAPTCWGLAFHLSVTAAAWAFLLWLWL